MLRDAARWVANLRLRWGRYSLRTVTSQLVVLAYVMGGCHTTPRTDALLPDVLSLDVADSAVGPSAPPEAYESVNPFIGTGGTSFGSGNCHPGATLPFAMVQAGPDTTIPTGVAAFNHATGYHADDTHVLGFSHNRLSGVSTPDLGAVLVTPGTADPAALVDPAARTYPFSHQNEHAEPGYYAVTLDSPDVVMEVTTTTRAAHHRYRFGGSGPARLVLDVGHAHLETEVPASHVEFIGPDRVEGWVEHRGRFSADAVGGFRTYFAAVVSPLPTSWGTFADGTYTNSAAVADGARVGTIVSFDAREVTVRLALSYVDAAGARANLDAELPAGADFDATRAAARATWQAQLNRVRFEGGTARARTIFATALYRSFVAPNVHGDVDGRYRGVDGAVHTAVGHVQHHFFSLWDTYRTTHPLFSLVDPLRQRDLMRSLLTMGDDAGGYLPRWTAGHASTAVTLGASADIALAESVLKGLDVPGNHTLDLILASAEAPVPSGVPVPGREGVESYVSLGYVAADKASQSVSRTLEYAIADAAIAKLAAKLGRPDVAARFLPRGQSYAALFDAETRVFRGKNADGSFVAPFDPAAYQGGNLYYGGNGAQYAWLAPHDPVGLVALFGEPEAAATALDAFFQQGRDDVELFGFSTLLPPSGYTQHNEPDIHAAYLFLAAGRPDLTQKWLRWVAEQRYGDGADGIVGNEDSGGLSAWLVWTSIGLYPAPGQDWYYVGRPLFDRVVIAQAAGPLTITTTGSGPYVAGVTLNGVALAHPWVRHGDLTGGATLEFKLAESPGKWGGDFGVP